MAVMHHHSPITITVIIDRDSPAKNLPPDNAEAQPMITVSSIASRGSRLLDFLTRHSTILKMVVDRFCPLP